MTARSRLARQVLAAAALASIGVALLSASGAVAQPAENVVEGTAAFKWEPANLTIKPGESVTFRVTGGPPHPVASGTSAQSDKRFDDSKCGTAQMSKVGDSCTVRFPRAGTFPYVCSVHLSLGMKGTITVGAGGPAGGGAAATPTPTPAASPDTPAAATTPPGKPGIYYAGWGLLALGGLLALASVAGYLRYAPDFSRERK
jgi:plastocyanin